jgi:EAL and modified HD-GYP domain-containing signal transduction protein
VLDVPILGRVALGYSPFIDRNRAVVATRLTVLPLQREAPLDVAELLQAVATVWPPSGGRVSLNVASESLLADLLRGQPAANVMVEVPSFMASDAANVQPIQTLNARGNVLLLQGRPRAELPREVLNCFKYAIIDVSDDRRSQLGAMVPPGVTRSIQHVQSGVRTLTEMNSAFDRGAAAVLGWPIEDVLATGGPARQAQSDLQVIVTLMQQLDAGEDPPVLEATLKRDPALAFKLLRFINSPAFGLRVEVSSFSHAIMLLGTQRLKRWLALLLATASKDPNLRPVMFAAVRRGVLMEELVRPLGDEALRNEMFVCGVFSLLDRMFQQPFAELFATIPVPEPVRLALVEHAGPCQPYLHLVNTVESGHLFDLHAAAEALVMSVAEVNAALMRALSSASQLE